MLPVNSNTASSVFCKIHQENSLFFLIKRISYWNFWNNNVKEGYGFYAQDCFFYAYKNLWKIMVINLWIHRLMEWIFKHILEHVWKRLSAKCKSEIKKELPRPTCIFRISDTTALTGITPLPYLLFIDFTKALLSTPLPKSSSRNAASHSLYYSVNSGVE